MVVSWNWATLVKCAMWGRLRALRFDYQKLEERRTGEIEKLGQSCVLWRLGIELVQDWWEEKKR
jgi:hypothetical protein